MIKKQPSFWRLVNLSLGLAAIANFAMSSGLLQSLTPSRWLLGPWFSASSMTTVSPTAIFLATIGVNLWLIASVFMILFWLAGLHRKLNAPRSKAAAIGLTLAWIAGITLFLIPMMAGRGPSGAMIMFMAGSILAPIYFVLSGVVAISAAIEIASMLRYSESASARPPIVLLAWAIVPPALAITPLLLAQSNPIAITKKENAEFVEHCKNAGVRFMEKPTMPVRSIAYDWYPELRYERRVDLIEIDNKGKIQNYGFAAARLNKAGKKIDFEFVEKRRDHNTIATINPNAPYYRFPAIGTGKPFYGIEGITADVLVFLEINHLNELDSPRPHLGATHYIYTLTDRRSGKIIGIQNYVVDEINKRACGANADNVISVDAFIADAINR